MAGVEADHARLRVAAKKRNGERVEINVPAVRDLLASPRSLYEIAKKTKAEGRAVDRRQLHRLRDGELRKIRHAAALSLAKALSVPPEQIIVFEEKAQRHRRTQPAPFPSIGRMRGVEVANRWWRAAGNQDAAPADLSGLFAHLLSYDTWRGALYKEGTGVLTAGGPPPVRARRNLEERRSTGNKLFSTLFGYLLEQPVKDTLCGSKALHRKDYQHIVSSRSYFGDFDPFGDFDLLLGAARQSLKIVDIPIRYGARRYGQTNISRFRHGWLLIKMSAFGFYKLKVKPVRV